LLLCSQRKLDLAQDSKVCYCIVIC